MLQCHHKLLLKIDKCDVTNILHNAPCKNNKYVPKGQIISKGLFGVLEFLQKRTNDFVVVVKTNLFVRLLGEFEDTKSPFEII